MRRNARFEGLTGLFNITANCVQPLQLIGPLGCCKSVHFIIELMYVLSPHFSKSIHYSFIGIAMNKSKVGFSFETDSKFILSRAEEEGKAVSVKTNRQNSRASRLAAFMDLHARKAAQAKNNSLMPMGV
jgi:hypothetical protein